MIPIFETVRVEGGRIRLRDRHLDRLRAAGVADDRVEAVATCFDEAVLLTDQPFILRVDVDDAEVRPSTRPPSAPMRIDLPIHWSYDPDCADRLLKTADRTWADLAEAEAGGEALLVHRETGRIGETTRASILLRTADGTFVVPRLEGILPGVTRAWAMAHLGAVEAEVTLDDLREARGMALLTAGRGVVPVDAVEGITLAHDPALDDLATAWEALP